MTDCVKASMDAAEILGRAVLALLIGLHWCGIAWTDLRYDRHHGGITISIVSKYDWEVRA